MSCKNVGFLNARCLVGPDYQCHIHKFCQLSSVGPCQGYCVHADIPPCIDGFHDVDGVSAGADPHQDVAFHPQRLYLLGKYLIRRVIIGNTGDNGCVCGEGKGRQGRALELKAIDKFSGDVLGIPGAPPIST